MLAALQLLIFGVPIVIAVAVEIPKDHYVERCHKILDPKSRFFEAAKRNLCNGGDRCFCSCNEMCRKNHSNLQKCCKAQGISDKCMKSCRYDVTVEELSCIMSECDILPWIYCGVDTYDDEPFKDGCRSLGVPEVCMPFCGQGLTKTEALTIKYLPCLPFVEKILQNNFALHNSDNPRWMTETRHFPREILTESQQRLVESLQTKTCNKYSYL